MLIYILFVALSLSLSLLFPLSVHGLLFLLYMFDVRLWVCFRF